MGAHIPGGGSDDLVITDLATLHFDPVRQGAAHGLRGTPPLSIPLAGLDIEWLIQAELTQTMFDLAINLYHFMHPREMPQPQTGPHFPVDIQNEGVGMLPDRTLSA